MTMKRLTNLFALLLIANFTFAACSRDNDDNMPDPSVTDAGIVINGVRWATRNVDAPGTFAATPESAGMFFQWNRRTGISTTTPAAGVPVENWNTASIEGTTWVRANDPCPTGWRVPTMAELSALRDAGYKWTTRNGVNGVYLGTYPHRIFLPALGGRGSFNGTLSGVGMHSDYWSNAAGDGTGARGLELDMERYSVNVFAGSRNSGSNVRCVAE